MDAGLDYEQFWRLTPGQTARILRCRAAGESERISEQIEVQRALNNELAALISMGFHNPKKLPKYKPLKSAPSNIDREPTEEDHETIKAFFKSLAGSSK